MKMEITPIRPSSYKEIVVDEIERLKSLYGWFVDNFGRL